MNIESYLLKEMVLPEQGHPCQLCAKGSSYDLVIHLERAATFSCRPLRVNREPDLRCRYVAAWSGPAFRKLI